MKKIKFYSILTLTLLIGCLPTNVSAKTKATTPIAEWRYPNRNSTYVVDKQSKYYKSVWEKATSAWTKHGFTWKKVTKSKTHLKALTEAKMDSLKGLAGVCLVTYSTKTGVVSRSNVILNKTVLKKLKYTKQQAVNVAEHELGHSLGLQHNSKNSISVMNPANRLYSIKKSDVKGMKKVYSKAMVGDLVGNDNFVTVAIPIKLNPRVADFRANYSGKTHKITFTGRTSDVSHLKIKYDNKVVKNLEVKQNVLKFKVTVPFKGYAAFKVYGDKRLLKTVSAKKYATGKPVLNMVKRNKESVDIDFYTSPGNIVKIWENGKPIYTTISDIPKDNITLESSKFKNYDDLRITQHKRGQKTSKMVALPKLKEGEVYRIVK